jgi:O-antigen/teichoic acid export membrane protein
LLIAASEPIHTQLGWVFRPQLAFGMALQPHGENQKLFGLTWQSPLQISRTHSVLWNGASRLLQVGLQFLFVPVYISLLGPASYGLVVLSATLMAAFAFLDHMTSSAVTRAFGMHNGNRERSSDLWKILTTLEKVSVLVALVIALSAPVMGFYLTRHWTKIDGLDETTLWTALILIGGALASQFVGTLYAAGLMGLQRQKLLSVIRVFWTPAYYGIGAALLLVIDRSVIVLFAWQMTAFLMLAATMRWALWKTMPAVPDGQHSNDKVIKDIGRFGAGSLIMGLTGAAVSQIDKFMVASVSQPAQFAAYGLAMSIVMQAMTLASGPFATAMYPHFSQLLADENETALRQSYHRWTQVVVMISVLLGGTLFLLGPLLIDLWLGANSVLAPDIKRLLPIVLVAWVINGAITTPVMLIMASGKLHLIYGINLAAIVLALVFLPVALNRWGFEAGALYWLAVNLAYCTVMVALMHRSVLKGSLPRWLGLDVALPFMVAGVIFYQASHWIPSVAGPAHIILHAGVSVAFCCAALVAVMPEGRRQLLESLHFLRR